MNAILEDFSQQSLTAANKANLFKWIKYQSGSTTPLAEFHNSPEFMWAFTGIQHPFMNHILRAQLKPEDAERRLADTLASFRAKQVNHFMWWVEPDSQPENLGGFLTAQGLIYSPGSPAMAVDLHTLNEASPSLPRLTVEIVDDQNSLRLWCAATLPSFGLSDLQDIQAGVELFMGLGFDLPLRSYVGLLDGKPVGGSQLFLGAGVAGIYCVATVPEARGRGIGRALTLQPLRDARELGYRIAVLQASPLGMPVYQRIGFQQTARLGCYIFSRDSNE